jgi:HPt (histidine-containing phosphotransfer) domain-containing protein
MDDYLSKPFEPEGLAAVLQRWITELPGPAEQTIAERLDKLRDHVPPGTVERLLTTFVDDGAQCLAELDVALARDDTTAITRAAHTFKGAAATIGATNISAVCESLEEVSREHDLVIAPEILARLQGEYDATRALLEHLVPATTRSDPP